MASLEARLYARDSAQWSPPNSDTYNPFNEEVAYGPDEIGFSNHSEAIPFVPRPPTPSVGGRTGIARAFGWTTGLLPSRTFRQRFTGKVLVVPNMGVHPVVGPVGYSTRLDRLAANTDALTRQWLPDPQQIADSFTKPNGIQQEFARQMEDG